MSVDLAALPLYASAIGAAPAVGREGQFLYITSTGDSAGVINSVYVWSGGAWSPYPGPSGVFANFSNITVPHSSLVVIDNCATVDNTVGAAWNPVTGAFTAPRAGWYGIDIRVSLEPATWTSGFTQLQLRVNGVRLTATLTPTLQNESSRHGTELSVKKLLNAGDIVDFALVQNSGTTKTIGQAPFNTLNIVEML